jgi:rod shape-determining protein MreD
MALSYTTVMKLILTILYYYLIHSLQCIVFTNSLLFSPGYPDFALLSLIFMAMYGRRKDLTTHCIIAGITRDVFCEHVPGISCLVMIATIVPIMAVRDEVFKEHILTVLCITVAFTGACHYIFKVIDFNSFNLPSASMRSVFGCALLTSLVAILLNQSARNGLKAWHKITS